MRRSDRPRGRALGLALLLVVSAVVGVITVGTQPARADVGEDGCADDIVAGLVIGAMNPAGSAATVAYSNIREPCFAQNNDVADVDTRAEAKRRIAQLALEDRRFLVKYFDAFDRHADRLENPAYLDAKTAFVQAMRNGSSESAAITDARQAVHKRTASQQRALWSEYSSVLDTLEHLELQAEDEQVANESLYIGYIENGTFVGGFSLTNYSAKGATTTVTLANGEQIEVPAPYKAANGSSQDTLHPLEDKLTIRVYNPETGENESIVNTADIGPLVLNSVETPGQTATLSVDSAANKLSITEINNDRNSEIRFPSYTIKLTDAGSVTLKDDSTTYGSATVSDSTRHVEMVVNNDSTLSVEVNGRPVGTTPTSVDYSTVNLAQSSYNDWMDFQAVDREQVVLHSFVDEFGSRHATLETVDNNVIDALGNQTSGYLHDVAMNVDLGNINYSDVYTPYDRYRQSVEPSDVGEQSWLSYQYVSLGYGGANVTDTVEVTILAGSVVDGSALGSNKTVAGHLFTNAMPTGGSWTTGESYTIGNGADLGSAVHIQRTVTESYWENGTLNYRTKGKTTTIESGEMVVSRITDSEGNSVEAVDHTDRVPSTTNTTNLTSQINGLQATIEELRQQIDEDDDGNTPDGGPGAGDGDGNLSFDFWGLLPEISLPWASAAINLAAVILALVAIGAILLVATNAGGVILTALGVRPRN